MQKHSIVRRLRKSVFSMIGFMGLAIVGIVVGSFYLNYRRNLSLLEKKVFEDYKNLIQKINENLVSRYHVEYKTLLNEKKEQIKSRARLSYSILQNLYYENMGKSSLDEIKKTALGFLGLIRFDEGKGFYSVFSPTGEEILSPVSFVPEFKVVFKSIVKSISEGKENFYVVPWRYVSYPFKISSRVIYGVYVPRFNWVVITGFYLEDFSKEFSSLFLKRLEEIRIPQNTGLVILDNNGKIIFTFHKGCKNFMKALKKSLPPHAFSSSSCNSFRYVVYSNFLPSSGWKVFTFFVVEKIMSSFFDMKARLLKNFVLEIIISVFLIGGVFVAFFFYFSKFGLSLASQLSYLLRAIKKIPYSYEEIDISKLSFYEIKEIGKSTNEMTKTIKELGEKILSERNFYNSILKYLPYGVGVLTKNLDIVYANDYAIYYMGYDESIIGKNFRDLIPPGFNMKNFILDDLIKRVVLSREIVKVEKAKLYKKDGSFIYVYLAVAPILDKDTVERVVIIFYDITEELKLRRDLEKFRKAIETVPVSIVITDTDYRIEYVNPFFEKITGYSFQEVMGKTPKILSTPYNYKLYDELISTIKSGKTWEGEFLNRKKSGELYWEHAFITPILDSKGRIVNFVAVKEDITERKKFIEELKEAKEKAELASKVKSQFLANMSHEIRTPMNAIMGFIELLLDSDLTDVQRKYLKLVKDSTDNLLKILNDILDLSKFESQKIEFENKPLDIRKIINNCAGIFLKRISEKGLKLTISIDDKIPRTLIGDEVRISQIFNNLINNAVKFTDKGEIKIEARLKEFNKDEAVVEFCVSDTGIGIPQDKIEAVFEAFSQVDGSITRRFGGTGLGLAIAKKIVEHYNGKIWAESEEGKGTKICFTLRLKVSAFDLSEDANFHRDNRKVWKEDVRVLVVEDNLTNQILIKEILKKFGINVGIAENGIEAIKELGKKDYNLVLMDWHMPKMDGVETLEILRKLERGEDVKVEGIDRETLEKLKGKKHKIVVLTAAALKKEKEELLKKGFDGYLSKPINIDELFSVLKKFIA